MAAVALSAMSALTLAAKKQANSPKPPRQIANPPPTPPHMLYSQLLQDNLQQHHLPSSAPPAAIAIAPPPPAIPISAPAPAASSSPPSTTSSSPRSGPIEFHMPIPEEDEDESCDSVEPVTPKSDSFVQDQLQSFVFPHPSQLDEVAKMASLTTIPSPGTVSPLPTSAVPSGTTTPTSPARGGLKRIPSAAGRRFHQLFRREKSQQQLELPEVRLNGIPPLPRAGSDLLPSTHVAYDPSGAGQLEVEDVTLRIPGQRSSTGLAMAETSKLMFSSRVPERPARKRSVSMSNLSHAIVDSAYTRIAESGAGLKARRMSTCLPDDFDVETVELNNEFESSSHIPGRRGKMVGSGATAIVKLMFKKGEGHDVVYAVKEFRKRASTEDEQEYIKKVKSEYSIAQSLDHPNIVKTVRLCTHSGRWNHVMEYCAAGDMFSLVSKRYLTDFDKLCLFKQLINGVGYLHDHGIAHRDIKLENLLMTSDSKLKITDFGVSEVFSGEHPGLRGVGLVCGKNMGSIRRSSPGICGSAPYIAPEVLAKNGDYDPRPLDVWSCCIAYLTMFYCGSVWNKADEDTEPNYKRLADGWRRWNERHPDEVLDADAKDGFPSCGEAFKHISPPALKRLLIRMANPDPEKRITIRDVQQDRWFKSIECCSENSTCATDIDVSAKGGSKAIRAAGVARKHNHLPTGGKRIFD